MRFKIKMSNIISRYVTFFKEKKITLNFTSLNRIQIRFLTLWIRGSGSFFSRYGSEDPDPIPHVLDPRTQIRFLTLWIRGSGSVFSSYESEDPDLFSQVMNPRIRIHIKMFHWSQIFSSI